MGSSTVWRPCPTSSVKWVGCNPTYCNSSNNWHTNCSEWLAEVDAWSNTYCPAGQCWVEAGWTQGCSTDGTTEYCSSSQTEYYWAQSRPCNYPSWYVVQFAGPISPDYNTLDNIIIQTTGSGGDHSWLPCNNNQWNITIISGGGGGGLSGVAAYNTMQPNYWSIGLEVYGNQGEGASAGDMIYNYFWPQGGSWQATTSSGNKRYSNSPASGLWATAPAPGNNGGDWYDTCSCNYNG